MEAESHCRELHGLIWTFLEDHLGSSKNELQQRELREERPVNNYHDNPGKGWTFGPGWKKWDGEKESKSAYIWKVQRAYVFFSFWKSPTQ